MLYFRESFDKYSTGTDLTQRWVFTTGTPTLQTASGVTGGNALQLGGGNTRVTTIFNTAVPLTSGGVFHVSFWIKVVDTPNTAIEFFQLNTNVGSDLHRIGIQAVGGSGEMSLFATSPYGSLAVLIPSTATPLYSNQWHHIEYAAKYADVGGYIKIWVDRFLTINISGDTLTGTQPTSVTSLTFVGGFSSYAAQFDDIIVWDEAGGNFDFTQIAIAKEPIIETLDVDANDSVQFTPSTGSNFQNVDDAALHDSDSTYNESSTAGHVDLFTFENQANTPLQTFGVCMAGIAKKVDLGGVGIKLRMDSGGTTRDSSTYVLYESYFLRELYTNAGLDPSTGRVWTNTAVNSLKGGYKYETAY